MIDADVMQDRIRDANPVPTFDALDADELAYFVAATRTRRAAVMQAPTQHPTETTPAAPPPHRRGSVWAFAAAFVLILVVVGAAALAFRSDDVQVTDEPPPPTTEAAPSTTMAETPTEPTLVGSFVWSRAPGDQAGMGGTSPQTGTGMDSVVVFGDTLVAVGGSPEGAAVWTSTDGLTWTRVPHDDAVFGPGVEAIEFPTHMIDVTAGGPGLVAVGLSGLPDDPDGPPLPAVWVSDDGTTWSRTAASVDFEGPTQAVTSGGPGLIAFGDPGVHTSVDGLTWTVGRCVGCDFGYMLDATAGGPGLVAVGVYDWAPAAWYSTDGISWSRVSDDMDVSGSDMGGISSVANGGPGLVAVGNQWIADELETGEDKQIAVVWTSADGINWTRVPHDEAVFGDSEMRGVVAVGDGLVAVGGRSLPDSQQDAGFREAAAAWTSTDGITWVRIPHDEALFGGSRMNSLVTVGDGLVVVGEDDDGATSWTATPHP